MTNTASWLAALRGNTTGNNNAANGANTLYYNTRWFAKRGGRG